MLSASSEATNGREIISNNFDRFEAGLSSVSSRTKIVPSNLYSSILPTDPDQEEILLVDEVDVFFGSDFYGRTYNQVAELRRPEVAAIIIDIWNKLKQDVRRQRLSDVQASSPYRCLVNAMPSFQFLIDQEIRLMLDYVRRVDDEH